jgi:ketosteroid isomerase-like protein
VSRENVEIAKRNVEAFNRLDVDGFVESATPDFEWFPVGATALERGSLLGREGVEKYFEELRDTWEEIRLVAQEFRDLGDRTLFLGRLEGRGRVSGAPVESPFGAVFDFRGSHCSRIRAFPDHDEASRAASLTE